MVPLQLLTHVGICVSDMDRSLRFYRDCLGFRHEHELRVAGEPSDTLLRLRGVDLHAVYLARDGVRIELLAFASPPPPPPRPRAMNEHGLTHLSFRVADLDAALAALRAAGERVLEETVIRFPAYQSAACFIVDPDGQLIELVQAAGDPRVGAATGAITAGLLVGWATGGILFGQVTDRLGRSRTLLLTMLTYAIATAACAFATDVWMLAAFRFVAALGIGGEWAAGASLVAEVVPERRRVAAGALLYTSSPLGIFLATLVNDLFTRRIPLLAAQPDLAWRVVFLSGLAPAAVALWLRHATLGGLAMCIVTLVAWWGTNAFLPLVAAFLAGPDAGPSERAGFITYASTMFNLGGLVGTLATIPVARLGRRALFALYLAGGAASIWVTFGGDWDPVVRMRLLFLDGLTVYGVAGTFSFYLPEL